MRNLSLTQMSIIDRKRQNNNENRRTDASLFLKLLKSGLDTTNDSCFIVDTTVNDSTRVACLQKPPEPLLRPATNNIIRFG
jgi:hypothetical protein